MFEINPDLLVSNFATPVALSFDTEQMGYVYILKPYIEPNTHKLNQLC